MIDPNIFPRYRCPVCDAKMRAPTKSGSKILTSRCPYDHHYGFDIDQSRNLIYFVAYSSSKYGFYCDLQFNKLEITDPHRFKVLLKMEIDDIQDCQTFHQFLFKIETYLNFS